MTHTNSESDPRTAAEIEAAVEAMERGFERELDRGYRRRRSNCRHPDPVVVAESVRSNDRPTNKKPGAETPGNTEGL